MNPTMNPTWRSDKKELPKYICIGARNIEQFNEKVNEKILEGYAPIGGVAYYESVYCQALIKK
jgi:hypothetical protein